ncbi:hypothetical protein HYU16_00230 [Candidatus Woesearchaeota archaeon]|nr:hypothetical protein [Candidatus Woesearchaeota archaeon]
MTQNIVCRDGKCYEVKKKLTAQGSDVVGLIEEDLLKNELGDLYDDK